MLWLGLGAVLGLAAIYTIACWLTGEALAATWRDERRLRRLSLEALDRRCATNPQESGLIVSLTTIPSRIDALAPTLKSLLNQTARPASIRLCLPEWSDREQRPYSLPAWLTDLRSVTVVRCADEGPATKFLPTLRSVDADQAVVVLDDDRIYHPQLLAHYADLARRHPDEIIAAAGWDAPDDRIDRPTTLWRRLRGAPHVPVRANQVRRARPVDIVQGVHSYVVRPRFFDLTALGDFSAAPAALRFVDDVWLSAHSRVLRVVHPLPLGYTDFQPRAGRALFAGTSLGRNVNRAPRDEDRGNSVALRFFTARWRTPARP